MYSDNNLIIRHMGLTIITNEKYKLEFLYNSEKEDFKNVTEIIKEKVEDNDIIDMVMFGNMEFLIFLTMDSKILTFNFISSKRVFFYCNENDISKSICSSDNYFTRFFYWLQYGCVSCIKHK